MQIIRLDDEIYRALASTGVDAHLVDYCKIRGPGCREKYAVQCNRNIYVSGGGLEIIEEEGWGRKRNSCVECFSHTSELPRNTETEGEIWRQEIAINE